ncbi:MAG TPA: class I SAM-dependent methyltransferase, partial [Acidobacteriota bacterium]|nr:class I SAM-dependent methyltransferase [Acidobacteriota bacterium]
MRYGALQRFLPLFLRNYVLNFEASIERAVSEFAAELPQGARVLDAGAGEGAYSGFFRAHRYCGVDFALGDADWDYSGLDAVADLHALPFREECFDACLNIVTLEHVREPACVLCEISRTLRRGGRLLLVVPQDWEVHQSPHDYFRYTRYGVRYLLGNAGFTEIEVQPAGGFFRLLSRRLLNGLQFFPPLLLLPAALFLVPPA